MYLSSSLNIILLYQGIHRAIASRILRAETVDEKRNIMKNALYAFNKQQKPMKKFLRPYARRVNNESVSKSLIQAVSGILLLSTRQLSYELMSVPDYEAFINCCGGTNSKSKATNLNYLHSNYNAIAKMTSASTAKA